MPRVVALYRYPVKGFTPEACDVLEVLADGRIKGDRVLGFRFANSGVMDNVWSKKHEFIVLVNTPGIARLQLRFNHQTFRLAISLDGTFWIDEALDKFGRKRIAMAIENYVLQLDENPLSSHPERIPLRVVGDGITSRYQDNEAGQITLHSRESLTAVAGFLGVTDLSELRFRSNIAIEGLEAWEEQSWLGRKISIAKIVFEAMIPKVRCLATQVNPNSGKQDLPILKTLTRTFNQEKPTFAIGMVTCGAGGQIHVGDKVNLLD